MAERVLRVREYDLLRTNITDGNVYACTDSRKLYQDVGNSRILLDATQVTTEKKRLYDLVPEKGRKYYVWETSELWLWNNSWILLLGNPDYPEAYQYVDGDIYAVGGRGQNTYVDNNGMLGDGGVVVRDINRVIKGKAYIDETNDNLVISSFLGGGMKLLPNGSMEDTGALFLDTDENGSAIHYGRFDNANGEMYVMYDETHADEDPSRYVTDLHKYMVWHEGNLDPTDLLEDKLLRKLYEDPDGKGSTFIDNSADSNGLKILTKNNNLLTNAGFSTYNFWNDKTPVLNEIFIQDQNNLQRNSRIMGIQNDDGSFAFYLTYNSDRPASAKDVDELTRILNKGEIEQLINSEIRYARIEKVVVDVSYFKIVDPNLTRFLKDGFVLLVRFAEDSRTKKIKLNINDLFEYDLDDNIIANQQPLFFKQGNVYEFVINGDKLILLNNDQLASNDVYGNIKVTNEVSPYAESFQMVTGTDVDLNDVRYRVDGSFAFEGRIDTKVGFPDEESEPDKQSASYVMTVKSAIEPSLVNNFQQVLTNINENKIYRRGYNTGYFLDTEFEQGGIDGNGNNELSIIYVRQAEYKPMKPKQPTIIYCDLSGQIQFKVYEYDNINKIAESPWRNANSAYVFETNKNTKYMRMEFRYSDNATKLTVQEIEDADIKISSNGFSAWERMYPVVKDEFVDYEKLEIDKSGWKQNSDGYYEYNVVRRFVSEKTLVEGNLDIKNKDKIEASYIDSYNGGFKIIARILPRSNFEICLSYQRTQEVTA